MATKLRREVARRMKLIRKRVGLTETELGLRVGRTQAVVNKKERALVDSDLDYIEAFCAATGCAVCELFADLV